HACIVSLARTTLQPESSSRWIDPGLSASTRERLEDDMLTIQWRTLLATACLCLIPAANRAAAATISKISGDDNNTSSTVDPGIPGGLVYSCIWVDSALPKAGFDKSTGWSFTYAGAADA